MRTKIEPLSPEWHAHRAKSISATDVGEILGLAPASQGTAAEVWARITGKVLPGEIPESDEIVFGSLSEQLNADLYTRKFIVSGTPMRAVKRPGGFWVDDEFEWLCASPDGFVSCPADPGLAAGVWEAKAPSHGHSAWDDDEIPEHYLCQVYAQMRCTGLNWGSVSALMQPVVEVRDVDLERELMDFLMGKLVDFWEKHVQKDVRPPATASERDKHLLGKLHKPRTGKRTFLPPSMYADLDTYRASEAKFKELEDYIERFKNNLRALCVDEEAEEIVAPDGSAGWTFKLRKAFVRPACEVREGFVLNPMKKVKPQ